MSSTNSSNVTLQNIDTSINITDLVTQLGIEQKENENDLFVSNIDLALSYNSLSMERAQDVYDQRIDSANQAFAAGMVGASGSAFSAASSGVGAAKMTKFDPAKGSLEFQQGLATSDRDISTLQAKKSGLESAPVTTSTTAADGEVSTGADPNGRLLRDVTEPEYQNWKNERSQLKSELDNPAHGLNASEITSKQQQLGALDNNIGQYEDLQRVNSQLGRTQSDRNMLVAGEQRRQADQSGMMWRSFGEFGQSIFQFARAPLDRASQITSAEATLDETSQSWASRFAEAFTALANDHLSNSNNPDEYINNAISKEASFISGLKS